MDEGEDKVTKNKDHQETTTPGNGRGTQCNSNGRLSERWERNYNALFSAAFLLILVLSATLLSSSLLPSCPSPRLFVVVVAVVVVSCCFDLCVGVCLFSPLCACLCLCWCCVFVVVLRAAISWVTAKVKHQMIRRRPSVVDSSTT
jgi:hypothetical protein